MTGFNKDEVFRIGINGVTVELVKPKEFHDDSEDFKDFESQTIDAGTHSLDIAVLSDFQTYDADFESRANVLIKNITIENTIQGGAAECLPCPPGLVNTEEELNSYCSECPEGTEPNSA